MIKKEVLPCTNQNLSYLKIEKDHKQPIISLGLLHLCLHPLKHPIPAVRLLTQYQLAVIADIIVKESASIWDPVIQKISKMTLST